MKVNRAHYSSFVDPDGGEWIAMVAGKYKGAIWRPAELEMTEDMKVSMKVEFLGDPVEDYMFTKIATAIISDQLTQIAAEDQQLVESFPTEEIVGDDDVPSSFLKGN